MRTGALAFMLLMASCGQGDPVNQAEPVPGVGGPQSGTRPAAPAITIAATGPGGCAASWDGQPVTPAQITARGVAMLERAIADMGGPANMTPEMVPIFTVEAPAELSMACAETILFALQRSGLIGVRLRTAGGAPILADFPLNNDLPPPPIPMVLGVGARGQVTWNNDPIDAAGLAAQLTRIGGSTAAPDPIEGGPPPGGLELRVAREATFGQLHDLLRTTSRYHLRPYLFLPSAEAGVAQPAPVVPPPPAGTPPPPR